MKRLILALMLVTALTGCTGSTQYGPCIGAFDVEDPALRYQVSLGNVVLACVFSETLIVPAVVVLTRTKCPEGKR